MEGALQRVTDLASTVLPGNPEASVTLVVREHPSTVVATGLLAVDLDEGQYECGSGPCLHAAVTRQIADVPDTRSETRWPDYARRAAGSGALSSLSVPLVIDAPQVSGSLNLYAQRPNGFDEGSRSTATRFGLYAALAAGTLSRYRRAVERADRLEVTFASRAVIEQARGMLMERHGVTPDGAFRILARASMHTHSTVRRLAEHLVDTGVLRCR
ncbi:GAF and ANTAR domain-containing protein [Geodermatophilus obscurus]|nr:GAF and ANTAR domain-containing protein [Geodermatophilus obscurus]